MPQWVRLSEWLGLTAAPQQFGNFSCDLLNRMSCRAAGDLVGERWAKVNYLLLGDVVPNW